MSDKHANLQLSSEEMRLVSDPGWILTKNSIVGKVVGLMAGLADAYREVWAAGSALSAGSGGVAGSALSAGSGSVELAGSGGSARAIGPVLPGDPKVSRGENYRGLPWVMLDFPRVFGREDVLAIRTFFLWGGGFNITLHLKGQFHRLYLPVIRERRAELEAAGFQVGVHPDEWRHEHTEEVFKPFGEVDDWGSGPFLKLSAAVGLDRWMEAPDLLTGLFGTLAGVLKCGAGGDAV